MPALKDPAQLAAFIDHTALKATTTQAEIETLCDEALKFGFFSVCIHSSWLRLAGKRLAGSKVLPITVVGFPLGGEGAKVKAFESQMAIETGAREIDMVINLGFAKSGLWTAVEKDIQEVVRASAQTPVKVIIETAYLSDEEIVQACLASVQAGAAFVKTSTGFGPAGATAAHIALMRKTVGPDIGVKASGGVRTLEDCMKMIDAGATRIGSSNSVKMMQEFAVSVNKLSLSKG